ncbi:MAG TPA: hypothetical protein VJU59_43260 [Paraburkholderia sp.]|uniref:hypothetical protein n=1 Tax=Paraburkholderia sp. TaxID=1926495 RepID=UPI002B488842|nr:hypothetical protein [Paraburkholderia sp.]HKR46412.1 hypothetical protein [Paraburkholderia sp.]
MLFIPESTSSSADGMDEEGVKALDAYNKLNADAPVQIPTRDALDEAALRNIKAIGFPRPFAASDGRPSCA